MHIDFHDQTNAVPVDYIDVLQRLLLYTAEVEEVSREAELSVSFVSNKEIRELNRNYRQKDQPTDVISFALQEPMDGEIEITGKDLPLILGDIVISTDQAKEQAIAYDHSFKRELAFLIVHGFLHLLGYNHLEKVDEKEMFQKQEKILGEFGIER